MFDEPIIQLTNQTEDCTDFCDCFLTVDLTQIIDLRTDEFFELNYKIRFLLDYNTNNVDTDRVQSPAGWLETKTSTINITHGDQLKQNFRSSLPIESRPM